MVRDAWTGKVKHAKNHVEWFGAIFENDGTVEILAQKIGVHQCTEKDFAKFNKIAAQSKKLFETYHNEFFCINDLDVNGKKINKKLYGNSDVQENRTFNLVYRPCIPEQLTDENKDKEDELCLADYNNTASLAARW